MAPSRLEHTIGIDEGTTGVRAAVVAADGSIKGLAYREVTQHYPEPGWVEQDPNEIWRTTRDVVAGALAEARLSPGDVAAVGITNQRGSAVLQDDGARALGPVVSWQDQRTAKRCEELMARGVFASSLTAASKYEWLVKHHGAGRGGALRCGTVDTWLASCLTSGATHATDHSNASVSGLYEFMEGRWDERAVEAFELERDWLPALHDTSGVLAETDPAAFGARVPIAALAGDQHAAMYGLACHTPGTVKLSLGTSGMMNLHAGTSLTAAGPGAYPLILWSMDGVRSYCLEGTTITAGAAAQWLRDGLGLVGTLAELEPLARSVSSTGGVWAVPAFQGLGTPHLDTQARAAIGGLSRGTTRAHVARAVLEGIAWRCREVFDALTLGAPQPPAVLRVDGGAAANALLLELLADALGIPVERADLLDSAVLGAALLAGRAVGLYGDSDVASHWKPARRFEPRLPEGERAARHERWHKLVSLVREAGT
jgi:glycerol kinase